MQPSIEQEEGATKWWARRR